VNLRDRNIIVLNRTLALAVGNGGANDICHIDEEGFVRFRQRVAVDLNRKAVGAAARSDGLTGEAPCNVVVVRSRRRVVRSGDVEGHTAWTSGRREAHREGEIGRTRIAFDYRNVVDTQVR
jgi:hypothetical protein